MDALTVLKARHEALDALLHEMSCALDGSAKRQVLEDIARELAVVFTLSRGAYSVTDAGGADIVDEARGQRMSKLIAELRQSDVSGARFDAGVVALQEELDCELDEQETTLLPRLAAMPHALSAGFADLQPLA